MDKPGKHSYEGSIPELADKPDPKKIFLEGKVCYI